MKLTTVIEVTKEQSFNITKGKDAKTPGEILDQELIRILEVSDHQTICNGIVKTITIDVDSIRADYKY